jgi:hypothetical protein
VPSTLTTLRPAARTCGSRAIRAVGSGTAGEGLQDRAGRGQVVVELAQDRGALNRLAQLAGAGRLERHGAADPGEPQREAGQQDAPAHPVEGAEPAAQLMPQAEADELEAGREEPSDQQRAAEREQRRVGRLVALGQQQRAQPRPQKRAGRKSGQRQRPYDQPLVVSPEGHQHCEDDDDPVEGRHSPLAG